MIWAAERAPARCRSRPAMAPVANEFDDIGEWRWNRSPLLAGICIAGSSAACFLGGLGHIANGPGYARDRFRETHREEA
jgi:hypothetical protein